MGTKMPARNRRAILLTFDFVYQTTVYNAFLGLPSAVSALAGSWAVCSQEDDWQQEKAEA
jgi:hypothetical protein